MVRERESEVGFVWVCFVCGWRGVGMRERIRGNIAGV